MIHLRIFPIGAEFEPGIFPYLHFILTSSRCWFPYLCWFIIAYPRLVSVFRPNVHLKKCKVVHKLLHLAPYFKRSTIWFSLSAIDSDSVFIFNDQLHVFFINQLQVSSIFQSHSICAMSKMRPFQLIHFHCKINLQSVNELESFECSIPHDFMEIPRIYTI